MGLWWVQHIFKYSNSQLAFQRWKNTHRTIEKLLVANRGEIACRVMKTAQLLGIKTVAVYSDADKKAMHVDMADESYRIGPASAQESYLNSEKIIDVAKKSQCQAIHPGYGFLSENVEFAEACHKNHIIFIGPPASAIRDMGVKSTSKEIMSMAGVPIIEGYHGTDQSHATLKSEATKIGYPIMIKAIRGGGGKGMRIALTADDFDLALDSARREARKAFGNDDVLLEKFVAEPRHVEVQVFADNYGNTVHLFERDCSVQRRHQKIIEEAPAPGLSEVRRRELGGAAVKAAKAVGYVGAGTVEFILDKNTHEFYFMEMNTRLQVEHPVTEMITGLDLVEWQIKVAAGESLPLNQEEIGCKGHAFEARIYAENPNDGFLPGAGLLKHLTTPQPSKDVRIETGVREGDEVSVYYDPMIAKLVVWGKDRPEALRKITNSLTEYHVAGLETNVNFLINLCQHPAFQEGNVHTNFIKDFHDTLFPTDNFDGNKAIVVALAVVLTDNFNACNNAMKKQDAFNPFIIESDFRVNYLHTRDIQFKYRDQDVIVKVKYLGSNKYQMRLEDQTEWKLVEGELLKDDKLNVKCSIDGWQTTMKFFREYKTLTLFDKNGKTEFGLLTPNFDKDAEDIESASDSILSPMPGILDKVLVKEGDRVRKGDSLVVLIAMKMEHVMKAEKEATIAHLPYKIGDSVPKDGILVKFEAI